MDVENQTDRAASRIAAAIGEPARACMLYRLLDGRARTSTELAMVAEVSPSTASVHLQRLKKERLIKVFAQGKHRYWSLEGPDIARMLEGLNVLAGRGTPASSTPEPLRAARTCYGHLAGTLAVALHDHFCASKWLSTARADSYHLTPGGEEALAVLGIDLAAVRKQRSASPTPAWIGASAARISAGRWGRAC